jgi:2-polyprenyl-3-methyl-5-hydroxy-6-metoxy-1,4-benzoquinol methylase
MLDIDGADDDSQAWTSDVDWRERTARSGTCPVCDADGEKPFVLSARGPEGRYLDLFSCPRCGAKFFPDLTPPSYGTVAAAEGFHDFYLEVGAGVDQLVRHVFAVAPAPGARYLEVGCGFGFALDFAKRALGMRVLGVDPSPIAAVGARILDVPIIADYLTADSDFGESSFDLVVASEVLEHIFDPLSFVQLLAGRLGPDGVLILTTPDADMARPTTPTGALSPLLSAGWHAILYSPRSLELLLRAAGFRYVTIARREHTLVAFAASSVVPIAVDATLDRNVFMRYLEERRRSAGFPRSLINGLNYRLLKELTNAELYARALDVYEELRADFRSVYAIDVEAPWSGWLHESPGETLSSFAARIPLCLCGVAHLRGLIALNHDQAPERAEHFFSLSVRHGVLMRDVLRRIGTDDAETEVYVARGRVLVLRSIAYSHAQEAAIGAVAMLARIQAVAVYRQQREDILSIFAHCVNLGAFETAELMAPAAEAYLKSADARWFVELRRALGNLELNGRQRPLKALLHYALAERAARTGPCGLVAEQASGALRHARFTAWLAHGDPRRAALVARRFEARELIAAIPAIPFLSTFVDLVNLGAFSIAERLSADAKDLLARPRVHESREQEEISVKAREALRRVENRGQPRENSGRDGRRSNEPSRPGGLFKRLLRQGISRFDRIVAVIARSKATRQSRGQRTRAPGLLR